MSALTDSQVVQVEQIRWFVAIALKGELPESARFFQVQPGTSHIHWLVGHIAYAIDRVSMSGFGLRPSLPERPVFSYGAKPEPDPAKYPAWEVLVRELDETLNRLRDTVAGQDDTALAAPLPAEHPFAKRLTARSMIVPFAGLHTSYHLGQISLLRRAQGLASGMPM